MDDASDAKWLTFAELALGRRTGPSLGAHDRAEAADRGDAARRARGLLARFKIGRGDGVMGRIGASIAGLLAVGGLTYGFIYASNFVVLICASVLAALLYLLRRRDAVRFWCRSEAGPPAPQEQKFIRHAGNFWSG